LKGSNLKNTDYVLGVVVYTGYDTKIMKNGKVPNSKVSKFMKTINKILYAVMLAQTCLCFILAYFSLKWQKNHIGEFNYIIIVNTN
jgi:magnesium-transporting ATPase (P-type)